MSKERPNESPRPYGRLIAAGLAALTLAAYIPVMTGDYRFLWDDRALVSESTLLQADDALQKIWFSTEPMDYWPLTYTTFWAEWRLWGANATLYHLTNVLLHAVAVLLLWRVLRRLNVPGAALAAALFAVHPVAVASVAWISERKNTLSMVFFLLAALAYLRWDGDRRRRWYAAALGAFLLALLSKASVVMFPVAMLAAAWWLRGRISLRRDVWPSIPFFLLSLALGLATVFYQGRYIDPYGSAPSGLAARIAGAGWAVWFYLYKALLPVNLMLTYPRWDIDGGSVLSFVPLGLLALVLGVLAWAAVGRRLPWARPCLFALVWFVLMLAPVLGLVEMSWQKFSQVADHFQYLSLPALMALIAGGGAAWVRRHPALRGPAIPVAAVLVLLPAGLTWKQQQIYRDDETVFTDTLAKNPRSWLACDHLGIIALAGGRSDRAMDLFNRALELRDYPQAHNNLANALARRKQFAEAERHYRIALEQSPRYAAAHYNLAVLLAATNRIDEALEHYRKALEYNPRYVDALNNLGKLLYEKGRVNEAIETFRSILTIQPDSFAANLSLGAALASQGRDAEAMDYLKRAMEMDPDSAAVRSNMAAIFARAGRADRAAEEYLAAVSREPDDPLHRVGLANALLNRGRLDEAVAQYQQAMRLRPNLPDGLAGLAVALTRLNRLDEAIPLYRQAIQARPGDATLHNNLAAALAAKDLLDEAIREYQEALRLQPEDAQIRRNLQAVLDRKAGTSTRPAGP